MAMMMVMRQMSQLHTDQGEREGDAHSQREGVRKSLSCGRGSLTFFCSHVPHVCLVQGLWA
jgi:hypothetical protein